MSSQRNFSDSGRESPPPTTGDVSNERTLSYRAGSPEEMSLPTAPAQAEVPGQAIGLPPHRILAGRYRLIRAIGSGAFGIVFEGWDETLRRAVAVKVLKGVVPKSLLEEWLREARTLAALDHPGIVPVFDVGQDNEGQPFLVSKLVTGGNLGSRLKHATFSPSEAAQLVADVARALDYAHRQRVVHRDIKPANILLTTENTPVIADFGLALHESDLGTGGRFVGTPAYMSPEQARREGHRVDGRSDIYSLGVVLYELLTGSRPFQASDLDELLQCIRHIEVRPLRQIRREVPRELERVCLRALAKRASDRYPVAADFADELLAWLATAKPLPTTTVEPTDSQSTGESAGSRESAAIHVIPRGLRPFSASDADFFLHLLPGPRDQQGIPDSVRFWTDRIEPEYTEQTFRVGVILGPSGCGKSSLVRAGIVPRLSTNVATIVIEARPDCLESHLLRRIHQLAPQLESLSSPAATFRHIRQHGLGVPGRKLLLVLDQFEQWLAHHGQEDASPILEMLRQCDGTRVQAVILTRDDFTLPLASFMDRLEEPLRQNHNFSVVDFFSLDHARRVLTAFGRAYGAIEEEPTRDQQRFIESAVQELAAGQHVVPVQLALFADMIKDQPWSIAALRSLGGARGVGVAFLDDRLCGRNAHPEFRTQASAVRRLLQMLLPEGDSQVRPPACPRTELVDRLRGEASDSTVEKLLGLLDSELRLVTPSSSSELLSGQSDSSSQEPAYQLTHDYLVPAIRQWLTAEERSSRRGRAMIRLRELTQAWTAQPEPRRLPTWGEWLGILAFTTRADRTPPQKKMLRTATQRALVSICAAVVVILSLGWVGWWGARQFRVESLAQQIANADLSEIGSLLVEARPMMPAVAARLAAIPEEDQATQAETGSPLNRRRLNRTLAKAQVDSREAISLPRFLPLLTPNELGAIRAAWPAGDVALNNELWEIVLKSAESRANEILPAAALLAEFAKTDRRWEQLARPVVSQLASVQSTDAAVWTQLLRPVGRLLAAESLRQFQATPHASTGIRANLLDATLTWDSQSPPALSALAAAATVDELVAIMRVCDRFERNQQKRVISQLVAGMSQLQDRQRPVAPTPAPAELHPVQQRIDSAGGYLDGECALTPQLPRTEWESWLHDMSRAGFQPSTVRPYQVGKDWKVAVAWQKSTASCDIRWDLTTESLRATDRELLAKGLAMRDFAWYYLGTDSPPSLVWVAVWEPSSNVEETRAYFDVPNSEHDKMDAAWKKEGRFAYRYSERPAAEGMRYTAIWRLGASDAPEVSTYHQVLGHFGEVEPGEWQCDARLGLIDEAYVDRTYIEREFSFYKNLLDDPQKAGGKSGYQLFAGLRLSAMGLHDPARQLMQEATEGAKIRDPRYHEFPAIAHARARQVGPFKEQLDLYSGWTTTDTGPNPSVIEYLHVWKAIFDQDSAAATAALYKLRELATTPADSLWLARGLAIVVREGKWPEVTAASRSQLRELLAQLVRDPNSEDIARLIQETDFDGVRTLPEIAENLRQQQFDRTVTAAFTDHPRWQSRWTLSTGNVALQETIRTRRAEGFMPIVCTAVATREGEHVDYGITWQREAPSVATENAVALTRANFVMLLARLGETEWLRDGLATRWGADVQSWLITHAGVHLPSGTLTDLARKAQDEPLQRGLALTLGGIPIRQLAPEDRAYLEGKLRQWSEAAPQVGVRHAATWCLQQWGLAVAALANTTIPTTFLAGSEFRNSIGQSMVVLESTEPVLLGSPAWEPGRDPEKDRTQKWTRLEHKFAIAATETTIEQFQEYLRDPKIASLYERKPFRYSKSMTASSQSAQISVSWIDAARFCEWLSEVKERLPPEEWCYPGLLDENQKAWNIPADYRGRKGYRLPTGAEWEFAARGGVSDSRYWGQDPRLSHGFEWLDENSGGKSREVGLLRPNPFGLFDMLGNVTEWCDELNQNYRDSHRSPVRADDDRIESKHLVTGTSSKLTLRGGRFRSLSNSSRSAAREYQSPNVASVSMGFRVARTVK